MASPTQGGQALIEALVVMGALASACVAVAWLGRLRDMDLQAMHASRHQAFAHAHQGSEAPSMAVGGGLAVQGMGQHWETRHGERLLSSVDAHLFQAPRMSGRQPGDPAALAPAMRRELRLGDETVWISVAGLTTAGTGQAGGGLRDFDRLVLRPTRHTAILRGAGSASGDADVQATLAGAGTLWALAADHSAGLGRAVEARARALDAPWGRPALQLDWLTPWAGRVPARHLRPGGRP
ncbi:hypothetical protein [Castellaniella sp. GW247-6E4]|uniref:hypothetical protein n=1 Tax=Castellaniella sp. GW247-6E4 TaxID=3140380 RepID=UPI0033156C37